MPALYKQCELSQGPKKFITWVPVALAVLDKKLELRHHQDPGVWTVTHVWERQIVSEDYLSHHCDREPGIMYD